MFSENDRISARQIKYLLMMEWIAGPCILLPVCLEEKTLGSVIICIALGAAFWGITQSFIYRWIRPGEDLFTAVSRVLGKVTAVLIYAAGFLFFLAQAAVFLNLAAELAAEYLLPEVPVPILCALPLAAGIYLSCGSIEVRGRFCEVIGPIIIGIMALLIFVSAFGMEAYRQEETAVRFSDGLARGGFEVFACMGGMFVPMLGNYAAETKKNGISVRRAGLTVFILGGSLCAVAAASYGRNGMAAVEFPGVRVMSNVKIPGNFLQRWDVFFLMLLLTGVSVTIAGSFWYMREIAACLCRKMQVIYVQQYVNVAREQKQAEHTSMVPVYGIWAAAIAAAYLLAAGFLNSFTAICYYRAFNMQILVPIMLFLYLLFGIRSWAMASSEKEAFLSGTCFSRKCRYAGRAFVLALVIFAVSFWLSGCTAREPEERLFPMAMQIEVKAEQGSRSGRTEETEQEIRNRSTEETEFKPQLVLTLAWDEATGPGEMLSTFRGSTLFDIRRQVTAFTERHVDFSHVKAILLDESLQQAPALETEVMQWLSGESAFASGLLVYPMEKSGLTLDMAADNCSGQIGTYLEQLYKNNRDYRESSTTLGRIIAEYFA